MIPTNTAKPGSTAETAKSLTILRLALTSGCLLLLGVMIYLVEVEKRPALEISELNGQVLIVVLVAFVLLVSSRILIRKKLQAISYLSETSVKLQKFRAAMIFNLALIELTIILSGVAYFLTCNRLFLIIAAIMLIQFFREKFTEDAVSSKIEGQSA